MIETVAPATLTVPLIDDVVSTSDKTGTEINMIDKNSSNEYNLPIDKIIVHNISIFFTFEGGPK